MTNVLLSADGDVKVYSVPDVVAKNLEKICIEYSRKGGFYDETDFIDWLNKYKYPYKKSVFVENLGWCKDKNDIPPKYRECDAFNF